ncbi:MAG: hypothetical protein BIFFINMI_03986 [Phycisphaerae bacterium]|nr:hypothetical protein [Phycisphaerae bacterium]
MAPKKGLTSRLSDWILGAISRPDRELGNLTRFAWYQLRLGYICVRQLRRERFNHVAAGLSFRTIFGLVPLLVMTGFIAQYFVDTDQLAQTTITVISEQTNAGSIPMPIHRRGGNRDREARQEGPQGTQPTTAGAGSREEYRSRPGGAGGGEEFTLQDFLGYFINGIYKRLHAKGVGLTGLLLLAYAAIALLNHIERAFNSIYHVADPRSIWRRLTAFWFTITLVPVLLGFALVTTSGLRSALDIGRGARWWAWLTSEAWSVMTVWLVLFVIYLKLPNTRVGIKAAAYGALTAAVPWLIAKAGFGFYVHHSVLKLTLFGAVGAVLLFFLWIYISWLIVLFGLEVTYVTQYLRGLEMNELAMSRRGGLMLDRAWLLRVASAYGGFFVRGEGPQPTSRLADQYRLPPDTLESLAEHLEERGILVRNEGRRLQVRYQLNRPPESISLGELAAAAAALDPGYARPDPDAATERVIAELADGRDEVLKGRTLADLIDRAPTAALRASADAPSA